MPYASTPGGKLYYETHGQGEPVLLHPGFGCTVEIYWRNTQPLAERFRVIVFDPRGAGRSDAGPPTMLMKDFADDAAALLDALGVESAHVAGTSFGGMVAQHIALEHPARVRRLVLACTTPGGESHVLPPAENMLKFMAASEITDPVAAMRSTYFLNYGDAFAAEHDGLLAGRALANQHLRSTPEGRASQINAVQNHDTATRLRQIPHPTLVAHGTEDGTVPVGNGRALAARIPNAELRLYPGGRHLFFTECADALNRDIARFLTAPPEHLASK
ncbi:MAG TPA: alpha/beta hydrolase [Dehalococcoidia bacterium]|nr:alpha/beta hydrolase [Dehalococcoidia bacterium]